MNFKFNEIFIKNQFLILFNFMKILRFFTFMKFFENDASHFNLACLPPFSGGLGLRDPERVHESAFLSSVFTYAAGSEYIPQCFWADVTEAWESTRETYGFPQSLINGYLAETEIRTGLNRSGGRAMFQTCVNPGGS